MATTFVVGGALSSGLSKEIYKGQLGSDEFVSDDERYWENPAKNVRNHADTYLRMEEQAEKVFDMNERRRLVVIGHSFGALLATKLGLNRPDIVAEVKDLAGLQGGYRNTIGVKAVKMMVGTNKGMEDGKSDSKHMEAFHEEIASEWSPDVGLTIDSALLDICFPLPQGLNIELPEGQQATRRVVGPMVPFLLERLKLIGGMPQDVELLTSWDTPVTEHIFLPAWRVEVADTWQMRANVAAAEAAKTQPASTKPTLVLAA